MSAGPDGVYETLNPFTEDKDQVYSTLTPTKREREELEALKGGCYNLTREDTRESAGPDGVYETLNPFTEDKDQVYSTLTPTKRNAVLESMSVDTSSIS
ncbi:hypothetical protein L3Q82_019553 [Scortum barcoo]|uniref:Uncharacterized protein n=1 Tax=Scortum barcoo TaxID=214431 RepID=A0ACB8VBN9_9TELE|nr:hypothetical protein L3Q82_019553 [Scortum barcoo]